jgi:hypothetical protein
MEPELEDILQSPQEREPRKRLISSNTISWKHVAGVVALILIVASISWLARDTDDKEAQRIAESRIPSSASITVEVINASGFPGKAQRYTDELRSRGFDVVDFGTDRSRVLDRTTIVDRSLKDGAARELAEALGLSKDRVSPKPDKKLYIDLTLVLGKDALDPNDIRPTVWRTSE